MQTSSLVADVDKHGEPDQANAGYNEAGKEPEKGCCHAQAGEAGEFHEGG